MLGNGIVGISTEQTSPPALMQPLRNSRHVVLNAQWQADYECSLPVEVYCHESCHEQFPLDRPKIHFLVLI